MNKWFINVKWGSNSMVALYLSVLSGLILAFQFDHSEPYYSTGTLELVVPFGSFWRSLHYFSSQIFFILLIFHVVAVLIERCYGIDSKFASNSSPDRSKDDRWLRLALSVPVAVLLLFTGYILRGDATGESAGLIAENIMLSIPVLGTSLNSFLFNIAGSGMKVVYANHLIGMGVLWGYLVWDHLRKYRVSWRENGFIVVATLITSMLVGAPLDTYTPGDFHISGPWFFVGLQELLRFIQPFWAGIFFPSIGVLLFYLVLKDEQCGKGPILKGGVLWFVVYLTSTIIGLLR